MKFLSKLEITIKDIKWKFHLMAHKQYIKMHGGGSQAITDKNTKNVYFDDKFFSMPVILHEMFHVYNSSSCIDSADLDGHQNEELGAEIVAYHAMDLVNNSCLAFDGLKLDKKENINEG